jgi:hypothetical protein
VLGPAEGRTRVPGVTKKKTTATLCYTHMESGGILMKLIVTLLGVILVVVAAVYFLMPADSLPSFFPGHETGLMRVRAKHGMVSGAAGVVLLAVSWFLGRK